MQVASSLVWIYLYSPQLGIQLKKMCKSLDCWSIDMLNFDFLEKSLGIVSPSYFVFDFSRKMFHVTGLDKFNICVHWFSCTWNGSARTFVHAKLHVHKTVMVDANLHHLQFANCHRFMFVIVCHPHILLSVNFKNISWGYAQHKRFSHFNWISTSELKIDWSRKLR